MRSFFIKLFGLNDIVLENERLIHYTKTTNGRLKAAQAEIRSLKITQINNPQLNDPLLIAALQNQIKMMDERYTKENYARRTSKVLPNKERETLRRDLKIAERLTRIANAKSGGLATAANRKMRQAYESSISFVGAHREGWSSYFVV